MARTTVAAVKELLNTDYDTSRNPSLLPRIDTANLIVSRVATCATKKGMTLSSAELEMIERWLAAHYYTKTDRVYTQRTTASASGGFVLDPSVPEPYLKGAIDSDPSGCLNAIIKGARAGAFWNGKPLSDQTSYDDRNGVSDATS